MIAAPLQAAGTAIGQGLRTPVGRVNAASMKLDLIDKRHNDFLVKALPALKKAHPHESICFGTKKTTHNLNQYEPPIPDTQI